MGGNAITGYRCAYFYHYAKAAKVQLAIKRKKIKMDWTNQKIIT